MKNPVLVSERLFLRPAKMSDARIFARFEAQETDDFIAANNRHPMSPLLFENWIQGLRLDATPEMIVFTVCLRATDEVIGFLLLVNIDLVNRTATTSSQFGPGAYRGKGYGTEAKMLLLEYAFEHLHLYIIQSNVFQTNQRSVRALLNQGYQAAGHLRWEGTRRGIYQDGLLFDVTRTEWLVGRDAWRARNTARRSA